MSDSLAQAIPPFEFTRSEDVRGGEPAHDVSRLRGTPGGWDPYQRRGSVCRRAGRSYPARTLLWPAVPLKSPQRAARCGERTRSE